MITKENIFTGFEVECDMCGYILHAEMENNNTKDTVKSVTEYMRKIGWSIGKRNLCSVCRKKDGE